MSKPGKRPFTILECQGIIGKFEKVNSSCQAVLAHGYYSAGIDFARRAAVYDIDEKLRYNPPEMVEEPGWVGNRRRVFGLLVTRTSLGYWDWSACSQGGKFGAAGKPTGGYEGMVAHESA